MNAKLAGVVCLVLVGWVNCRPRTLAGTTGLRSRPPVANADPEYRLGPGDLIEIAVFGVDKFKHTLRISASGMIKVPLLDPVMAAGLTAAELEERLASLLEGDIIRHPQVAVFVREYKSQPVFVLGAVKAPGQYQITQQLRLIDVLPWLAAFCQPRWTRWLFNARLNPAATLAGAGNVRWPIIPATRSSRLTFSFAGER